MAEVERGLERFEGDMKVEKIDSIIKETADLTLLQTFKKREIKKKGITEPKWMNWDIKAGIKKRKEYNRKKRRGNNENREIFERLYWEQKREVKELIYQSKKTYEEELAKEIKEDRDSAKKIWKTINRLKGYERNEKEIGLYDEDGVLVDATREAEEMLKYWETIYRMGNNEIEEEWNEQEKERYCEEMNRQRRETRKVKISYEDTKMYDRFPECLFGNMQDRLVRRVGRRIEVRELGGRREEEISVNMIEHYDALNGTIVQRNRGSPMGEIVFTEEELKKVISGVKERKQPGPDKLKGEIYKALMKSDVFIHALAQAFNKVMEEGRVPESWKTSRTVMLPKVKKPTAGQHRPIALTNTGYKLFMSAVKSRLVEHLEENGRDGEYQAGFTKQRRLEENLFILRYCVEESFSRGEQLIVVAVDFAKSV